MMSWPGVKRVQAAASGDRTRDNVIWPGRHERMQTIVRNAIFQGSEQARIPSGMRHTAAAIIVAHRKLKGSIARLLCIRVNKVGP